MRQVAAFPYRVDEHGYVSVLLVTSRETRRWVLPKGNLIKRLKRHEAAAQEAFEEAGVTGAASPIKIGSYRYDKRRPDGSARMVSVAVFPMRVATEMAEWPERAERERRWFGLEDAAAAIDEPGLARLIIAFRLPS